MELGRLDFYMPAHVALWLGADGVDGCEPEPTIEGIDAAWADLGRQPYNAIVAVGGGSVIDWIRRIGLPTTLSGHEIDAAQIPVFARAWPLCSLSWTRRGFTRCTGRACRRLAMGQQRRGRTGRPFKRPKTGL